MSSLGFNLLIVFASVGVGTIITILVCGIIFVFKVGL